MSNINPIRQILGIVRKTVSRRSLGAKHPAGAPDQTEAAADLVQHYNAAVESTGSAREGLKAIVSIQLANEFGNDFLKDPESKVILNKIVADLENLPEIRDILHPSQKS